LGGWWSNNEKFVLVNLLMACWGRFDFDEQQVAMEFHSVKMAKEKCYVMHNLHLLLLSKTGSRKRNAHTPNILSLYTYNIEIKICCKPTFAIF